MSKRVLRTPEAAEYIGLASSTLEKMRLVGNGPAFVRLGGRAVGYDLRDLDGWLDEQRNAAYSESEQVPVQSSSKHRRVSR